MKIRQAVAADFVSVMQIYEEARAFMRKTGNATQWSGGYPSEALVRRDLEKDRLFVCEENGELLGVFYYAKENDPTYGVIYEGAWLNDLPYAVIHRVAVSAKSHGKGVGAFIFKTGFEWCSNLKIDTHEDNLPMQRSLEKNGFRRCGIIRLLNGDERIAYQKY